MKAKHVFIETMLKPQVIRFLNVALGNMVKIRAGAESAIIGGNYFLQANWVYNAILCTPSRACQMPFIAQLD